MKQWALLKIFLNQIFMIIVKSNTSKTENYFFVVLQQNKVKGLQSSQGPLLNQKLIYAMKLQLKINFKT